MTAPDSFRGKSDFQVPTLNSHMFLLMEKGKNRLSRIFSYSNKMANEHERTIQDESPVKNNLTAVGRDD